MTPATPIIMMVTAIITIMSGRERD